MDKQVRACHLTVEASASQLANHPTVGLFYIRDHIRQSTPAILRSKTELDDYAHDIELATYDVDSALASLQEMKAAAGATFRRLDELLDSATDSARQWQATEARQAKARSANANSLKKLWSRGQQ